jgi:hypothetical protein
MKATQNFLDHGSLGGLALPDVVSAICWLAT